MVVACPSCGSSVPDGARFCANCGAQLGDVRYRAEQRKVVTILFADVTGSTSLGEQLDGRSRALRGDPEGATLLRSAVERFDAQSAIFEAARTRELVADALPDEARGLLESALAVYRKLRAAPHVTRVEERLAAL